MTIRIILACFLMCVTAVPANAQSYSQNVEMVSELNLIDPTRSPKYERAGKVLSRNILDRKNKVVGQVEDVVITKDGTISSLNVDLNRLRLGSLFLNYRQMGIRPVSNAFALSIDDEQLESLYPTLLADMKTASGSDDESFSVRKIIGSPVKAQDGRSIGRVKEVLFSKNATRVEALYMILSAGASRGQHVAIPFGRSMTMKNTGQRNTVIVQNEMADAAIAVAKSKK